MSENQEDAFRYDKMVESALRSVVLKALEEVSEKGLFDDHHFYITFRTDYPGVEIPDYLQERYPGEMTIVLQHQFYDLDLHPDRFSVMLKFNNVPERLTIPLGSVTIFTDPSVNFALQFQPLVDDEDDEERFDTDDITEEDDIEQDADQSGEVISLDQFRSGGDKSKKKKSSKSTKKKKEDDEEQDSD